MAETKTLSCQIDIFDFIFGLSNRKKVFMAKSKRIKLQPELRKLAYSEKMVPVLRLSGIWLEQSGFKIGEQVQITIRDQEIIIKPLS